VLCGILPVRGLLFSEGVFYSFYVRLVMWVLVPSSPPPLPLWQPCVL